MLGEPPPLASAARAAGLTGVEVHQITVERLRREAILAVADEPLPVAPTVLVLFASAA